MVGRRDSEIAVLVTDVEMVRSHLQYANIVVIYLSFVYLKIESKMNGNQYSVGKFCHSLRKKIFRFVQLSVV